MILAHGEKKLFSTFVTVETIAKYGVFLIDKGATILGGCCEIKASHIQKISKIRSN